MFVIVVMESNLERYLAIENSLTHVQGILCDGQCQPPQLISIISGTRCQVDWDGQPFDGDTDSFLAGAACEKVYNTAFTRWLRGPCSLVDKTGRDRDHHAYHRIYPKSQECSSGGDFRGSRWPVICLFPSAFGLAVVGRPHGRSA